jgi:hypothetical protein
LPTWTASAGGAGPHAIPDDGIHGHERDSQGDQQTGVEESRLRVPDNQIPDRARKESIVDERNQRQPDDGALASEETDDPVPGSSVSTLIP